MTATLHLLAGLALGTVAVGVWALVYWLAYRLIGGTWE